jgi:hypothetical protein
MVELLSLSVGQKCRWPFPYDRAGVPIPTKRTWFKLCIMKEVFNGYKIKSYD